MCAISGQDGGARVVAGSDWIDLMESHFFKTRAASLGVLPRWHYTESNKIAPKSFPQARYFVQSRIVTERRAPAGLGMVEDKISFHY